MKRFAVTARCRVVAPALFALAWVTGGDVAAHSQVYFPTDAAIVTTINDDVVVGRNDLGDDFSPTVTLGTGGSITGTLFSYNHSTFNMNTGSIVGDLFANDDSVIHLRGGTLGGSVYAFDRSHITYAGSNVTETLIDPSINGFSQYDVSGLLADGTVLTGATVYIQNGTGAELSFVPEPGSVAVFTAFVLTGGLLVKRRRFA